VKNVNIGFTNRLFAEGLELMINKFEGFEVLHSIHKEKLLNYSSLNLSDKEILILELDIPRKSDIKFIQTILEAYPGINILLITSSPSLNISAVIIESGISAYLLKSCISIDLLSSLEKISNGKNYFCSTITGALLVKKGDGYQSEALNLLTIREKEVLVMLVNNV
jgi:DNA-binding NarL/FixJ family response regulator